MRVCGTCGNTQGPFARLRIGDRKTGRWVFTCPPGKEGLPSDQRRAPVVACLSRRAKRDATK